MSFLTPCKRAFLQTPRRDVLLLVLIIVGGFLLRLYFASTQWVGHDEGNWLYDASLILKGHIPFIDYAIRSPLYIFLLVPFVEFFGNTILAGRLLSVFAEVISMLLIYIIGKKLYNKKIGILATFIYSFSTILIFWGSILRSEIIQRPFVLFGLFLFIKGLETKRKKYYLLTGLFIALAAFVRQSALIFLISLPIFYYLYSRNMKTSLKSSSFLYLGALAPLLWFYIIANMQPHFYFVTAPNIILRYFLSNAEIFGRLVINHLGMFYILVKESAYLIFPTVLFFIYLLKPKTWFRGLFKFLPLFIILFIVGYFGGEIIAYIVMANPFNLHQYHIYAFMVLLIICGLSLITMIKRDVNISIIQKYDFSNLFITTCFIGPFIFYLFYWTWHISYFTELAPLVSLISSVTICSLLKFKNEKQVKIFFTLLILMAIIPFTINIYQPFFQSRGIDRVINPATLDKVSNYFSVNVAYNEEMLMSTAIAFSGDRRIIFDISHPMLYPYKFMKDEDYHSINYPTVSEIIDYLENKKILYVVIDPIIDEAFLKPHPNLKECILSKYHLEKQIDNVKIYKRN